MPWPSEWPLYILAGGYSSRFGTDKARFVWNGYPLLQHVANGLPKGAPIYVVADRADKYQDLGFVTLVDQEPHLGPLGGLLTVLNHCSGHCGVVSCDLLGLNPAWFDILAAQIWTNERSVVFKHTRWEPFPGLYHAQLKTSLEAYLQQGQRACWRWLERISAGFVPLPTDWAEMQVINHPTDLRL